MKVRQVHATNDEWIRVHSSEDSGDHTQTHPTVGETIVAAAVSGMFIMLFGVGWTLVVAGLLVLAAKAIH